MISIDSRLYPALELTEEGRWIPKVCLPRDFKERVIGFYDAGGREEVEGYKERVASSQLLKFKIRLTWDERLGLKNINIGVESGLDLDEAMIKFVEHNIWNQREAIPAYLIATKYVSLLMSS